MPDGVQSRFPETEESAGGVPPEVTVCRSCPGKFVFIEAGNTDGWIATDATVEPVS